MNQDIALITEYMDKVLEGGEITRKWRRNFSTAGSANPISS